MLEMRPYYEQLFIINCKTCESTRVKEREIGENMSEFVVATHSLLFLDEQNKRCSSALIADNLAVQSSLVRKVLGNLERNNMVNCQKGKLGGYSLEKELSEITLGEIQDALDKPLLSIYTSDRGIDEENQLSRTMNKYVDLLCGELNEEIVKYLRTLTLQDVKEKIKEIDEA